MQYNVTYRKKDKGIQAIISYKDNLGKWRQKSKQGFKTKALAKIEVEKMLEELKKTIVLEIELDKEFEGITFSEFVNKFIEHQKLYKEGATIESYKTILTRFNKLSSYQIDKIKNIHIQECIDDMIKDRLNGRTIKGYLGRLKIMFNNAVENKIIIKSPIEKIIIPIEKTINEKKALTRNELEDLLNKVTNKKYYVISLLAGKCGLRLGEILGLTWYNIDLDNLIITVNQQLKIQKDLSTDIGTVKSKNSIRQIPITLNIKTKLIEFKNAFPLNYDGRLFKYSNKKSMSSNLKRYYKNVGYDISIHELRHTYATLLIANGIDFKTAANLLGHDVELTMKVYSHVTEDMILNASKKIQELF